MGGQLLAAVILVLITAMGALLVDSNGNQIVAPQLYPVQLEKLTEQSDKLFQNPLTIIIGFCLAVAAGLTFWGYGGAPAIAYLTLTTMEMFLNEKLHPFEFAFLIPALLGAYGAMVIAGAGAEEYKAGKPIGEAAGKGASYIVAGAVLLALAVLARNALVAVLSPA